MSLFDQAIKNAPGCLHPLVSRVLPFVGPIVNKVPLSKTLLYILELVIFCWFIG